LSVNIKYCPIVKLVCNEHCRWECDEPNQMKVEEEVVVTRGGMKVNSYIREEYLIKR
jgi:hypothetical protein